MNLLATALLGAPVVDRTERPLGRISDLLLDEAQSGRVCYALIDIEPPAHGEGRTVAVPWSILRTDASARRVVLDVGDGTLRRLRDLRCR
jgi:hypothetical protein